MYNFSGKISDLEEFYGHRTGVAGRFSCQCKYDMIEEEIIKKKLKEMNFNG